MSTKGNIEMLCADEGLVSRMFTPNDDGSDYTCTGCGWQQRSTADGAAELCLYGTWHSIEEYRRYAAVARAGGFEVPENPPNYKE